MNRPLCALLFACLLFPFAVRSQQPTLAKTLLWRISGNGLQKESYLFGSMHLQDKRIFNFGDSMYYYLQQAEGFALEVDMQAFVDSVFQQVINGNRETEHEQLSVAQEKKLTDSLYRNLKKNDAASRKMLARIREKKLRAAAKGQEMPTIVDGYLYGIARRQGKWLGAVEDVSNQLSLLNELGGVSDESDLHESDKDFRNMIEQMIRVYVSEDLGKLDEIANRPDGTSALDRTMIFRNLQMSRRMDSLAAIRSVFFTVGAAHLPGDSGVIRLLQRQGYTLSPVFSKRRIEPAAYTATLKKLPWIRNADSAGTFTVEMPGIASAMDLAGSAAGFQFYLDIADLTLYMSGSLPADPGADMNKVLAALDAKEGASVSGKKIYEKEGVRYAEAIFFSEGYNFRVQYRLKGALMYMMMAGKQSRNGLSSPEVDHFFQSMVMKTKTAVTDRQWVSFRMPGKAFTINFPGKPRRSMEIENAAKGTEWKYSAYIYNDVLNDVAMIAQVKEMASGYVLSGDSLFFNAYKTSLADLIDSITVEEATRFGIYPAYRLEWISPDTLHYMTFSVNRGNRVYALTAVSNGDAKGDSILRRFLSGLELLPIQPPVFKTEISPDGAFSTQAPSPVTENFSETEDGLPESYGEGIRLFNSFNPAEVVNYQVTRRPLGFYYSAKDDSSFLASSRELFASPGDSVLHWKKTLTGSMYSLDIVLASHDKMQLQRVRLIPDGDSLYLLSAYLLPSEIDRADNLSFFDGFRIKDYHGSANLFTDKTSQLISDLRSADSATSARAMEAFVSTRMTTRELPQLHEALLGDFVVETDHWYGARTMVEDKLMRIADPSTIRFIRDNYASFAAKGAGRQTGLLEILAGIPTKESYALLKDLLINHTPEEKEEQYLKYRFYDSLKLATTFYPELMKLLTNPGFRGLTVTMLQPMLDSNMLPLDQVLPYSQQLTGMLETIIDSMTASADYYADYATALVNVAGYLNSPEAIAALQKMSRTGMTYTSVGAVYQLLDHGYAVDARVLDSFASDKTFRADLYDHLLASGKEKLFPASYRTQRAMAESILYAAQMEEDEPGTYKLVWEKTVMYEGKQQRFFLYQVSWGDEPDEQYLGVAGPFALDAKILKPTSARTGVFYTEVFDPKKLDKLLADYLAGFE